ncbi:MAG: type II CRISPR-associated endonuclease Cas1 [Homoserinimonas sp.]|nr:type II CRISPR-associated endonuclease Cas1 [Homoserinimonas sp.]
MTAGRQVIDATRLDGAITSVPGGVAVGGTRVPLEDVAVLLMGGTTTISGGALTKLARYQVIILNCDWRGVPDLVAYGWSDNSRIASRHRAQAELSEPRRKSAWQAIVKAKILGQQRNLEFLGIREAVRLANIRKEVRSGDPANCEAQAARVYWECLFEGTEFSRTPGGEDRLNSLLNYGYAVARGFVIQAVCIAGLWPSYGLWHRNRSNTFVLADDLIEPFRPAVDFCVATMAPELTLDDRDAKRRLVAVTSEAMDRTGASVATSMRDFASQLAMYVEGDKENLSPPSWRPSTGDQLFDEGEDG